VAAAVPLARSLDETPVVLLDLFITRRRRACAIRERKSRGHRSSTWIRSEPRPGRFYTLKHSNRLELPPKPQPAGHRSAVPVRWVDRVVGLDGVRTEVAMMQTPDGNGRLELVKFHSPSSQGDNRHAPANTPGIRHVAFAVEDIDAVVAGLRARGAELVGELERYEDSYRLCYVRGPEGIIIELAEQIG
jgi:catechol 2,3-dioxygenase-like lactoylglutathione lyase family enzyme